MKGPLFAAVVATPADDAPRLVLADALSERDDPRGEFIVLQCRLASGRLSPRDAKAAKEREEALLEAHRGEWFGPLEKWLREKDPYALSHVVVRRGFVASCRLQVSAPADLAALFAKAPLLEGLELRGGAVDVVPQLGQLTQLDAEGEVADSLVPALAKKANVTSLQKLTLVLNARAELLSLAACPALERLTVEAPGVTRLQLPSSLEALSWKGPSAALPDALDELPALTSLRLTRATVDDALLARLRALAPRLVTLGLDGAKFAQPALLTSLLALKWPALETLDLSNVGLGPSGAAAVASLAAPKLESLDLTYTRLKDEGAAAVLASPLLRTLKEVSLRANTLSVAAIAPVLKAKHSLRLLNLKKNAIGAAALKQLEKKLPGTRLSR